MSLDDAIHRSRAQADAAAAHRRREAEQKQQVWERVRELCLQAVPHLINLGTDTHTRVEPAKWYQRGQYRDAAGKSYRVVLHQRCWIIAHTAGLRHGKGEWMDSPGLLLEDGSIGRFWPIPALRRNGASLRDGEFVSTIDLDSIEDQNDYTFHGDLVQAVTKALAEAVTLYERSGGRIRGPF
ncbi:hypothetical protein [Umezawaea sp. Da 62-37]|uniref:hypothetical protein n=1 Tax=Umezawaea sp. Da 62-37 TaxID=3075927 RepID=UPI0028F715A7|nr:hypothetical protein [Umezawaea sp. Da 62-37]WNV86675.1 hypothetical protein RM788_52610 [Umezawaea sp. Da 62-37]WNV86742.1 hypothetical protein RM788_00195 [Umezawaea sp. Da 62-37]